jgi:hypothetical protein
MITKKKASIMTGKWYNDVDGKTYSGILHAVYSELRGEAHIYVGDTRLFQIDEVMSEKQAKEELHNLMADGTIVRVKPTTPKKRK